MLVLRHPCQNSRERRDPSEEGLGALHLPLGQQLLLDPFRNRKTVTREEGRETALFVVGIKVMSPLSLCLLALLMKVFEDDMPLIQVVVCRTTVRMGQSLVLTDGTDLPFVRQGLQVEVPPSFPQSLEMNCAGVLPSSCPVSQDGLKVPHVQSTIERQNTVV